MHLIPSQIKVKELANLNKDYRGSEAHKYEIHKKM